MNHSYRLVWSDRAQRFIPVPETARGRGRRKALLVAAAVVLATPGWALDAGALPSGGTVAQSSAQIEQSGIAMTVTQGSGGTLNGVVLGELITLSQSGGTFSDKNVGTGKTVSYTNTVSGTDVGNYVLASSSGSTTADITPATLTLSGITAKNKPYDGTKDAAVGGGLNGVIGTEDVKLSDRGLFDDKNVGVGKTVSFTSSLSGADANNYVLASNSGSTTADITRALLNVRVNDDTKVFDAKAYSGGNGVTLSGCA
jgi:hypothetical protein